MAVAADHCDVEECPPNQQGAAHCQKPCTGHEIMAIVIGVFSVLMVGAHLVLTRLQHPKRDQYEFFLGPAIAILWTVSSAHLTSPH